MTNNRKKGATRKHSGTESKAKNSISKLTKWHYILAGFAIFMIAISGNFLLFSKHGQSFSDFYFPNSKLANNIKKSNIKYEKQNNKNKIFSKNNKAKKTEVVALDTSYTNKKANVKEIKATKDKNERKKPRFDFYNLLSDGTDGQSKTRAIIKADSILKSARVANNTSTISPSNMKLAGYLIQTGSFNQQSEAEEFKARLALLGFRPHIDKVLIRGGEIWYRVNLGPFKDKDAASKKQMELEKQLVLGTLLMKINSK